MPDDDHRNDRPAQRVAQSVHTSFIQKKEIRDFLFSHLSNLIQEGKEKEAIDELKAYKIHDLVALRADDELNIL